MRTYNMAPKLYLITGPNTSMPARMGPLPIREAGTLLSYTPRQVYHSCHNPLDGTSDDWKRWDERKRWSEMMGDAIFGWNQMFAECPEDQEINASGWRWHGIEIGAESDAVQIWISIDTARAACQVRVDEAALDTEARAAALRAYEELAPLTTKVDG